MSVKETGTSITTDKTVQIKKSLPHGPHENF